MRPSGDRAAPTWAHGSGRHRVSRASFELFGNFRRLGWSRNRPAIGHKQLVTWQVEQREPEMQRTQALGQRAQVGPQRRKWSDWSVCGENCIKTRHRLNCDDLLAQQSDQQSNTNSTTTTTNHENHESHQSNKQQATFKTNGPTGSGPTTPLVSVVGPGSAIRKRSARRDSEENDERLGPKLADASADDDDYADEGDEEDETDSCALVDTSRTFEEQACLGGQCPLAVVGPASAPAPLPAATRSGSRPRNHQRLRPNSADTRNRQLYSEQHLDNTTNLRHMSLAPKGVQHEPSPPPPSPVQRLDLGRPNATSAGSGAVWPLKQPSFIADLNASPQVQWTILIGSLLALVLLLLLTLRKLLASSSMSASGSYQWMLSKQTGAKTECCHQCARSSALTLDSPPGEVAPTGSYSRQLLHHNHHHQLQLGAHHRPLPADCVPAKWRSRQQQPQLAPPHCELGAAHMSSLSGTCKSSPSGHQLILEANGRHLLGGGGCGGPTASAKFNTDQLAAWPQQRVHQFARQLELDANGRSVISNNYHYDSPGSGQIYDQAIDASDHLERSANSDVPIALVAPKSLAAEHEDGQSRKPQQAPVAGVSRSSSVSAASSSNDSSPSLQSTTAQLLSSSSSAADSNLALEIEADYADPMVATTSAPRNGPAPKQPQSHPPPFRSTGSASSSPNIKRAPGKLVALAGATNRSQPNSPVATRLGAPRLLPSAKQRNGSKNAISIGIAQTTSDYCDGIRREANAGLGSSAADDRHHYEEIGRGQFVARARH